jgi:hypothetical protein
MSHIKRRQFLQFAGSTLATLGLSYLDVMRKGDRYAQVLAQSTPRKLALLVGINAYQNSSDRLAGCITDVEMQQHLLIHRFGFNKNDVHILTDAQATREGILGAFKEYLIGQAKPGDVVVFHFSGHGSRVDDSPECDEVVLKLSENCLNSTIVPADNSLPLVARRRGGIASDITGHTLFLLASAVNTENLTVVLDSCHAGGGKRGNLTVRALDGGAQVKVSPAEKEYQRQLLSQLNLSPDEYIQARRAGVAKGVVIASADRKQLAADQRFNGFAAGAFTYVMTQYLWQQTGDEPVASAIANIARTTNQISSTGQIPEYEAKQTSNPQKPAYFLNQQTLPAEAVITKVEEDGVQLWLGGVNSQSIPAFDRGAILTVIDAEGKAQGLVQLEANSRKGLTARGKLLNAGRGGVSSPPQLGTLLQERMRGIPSDMTLAIGLDPSLGNDKAKAEQALKAIQRLKVLPVQQEEYVAYLLGRITQENRQFQKNGETSNLASVPDVGSIGLFTPALELIPGSFGASGESMEAAVARLTPKFKSLLAAHIAKMILNPGSSRLNVVASMKRAEGETFATTFPVRGAQNSSNPSTQNSKHSKLPLETPLQFVVTNKEDRDLHVSVLVIDPEGEMTVIFPNTWTAEENATLVKAGVTLHIPQAGKDKFRFKVAKPVGMVEVLVIASGTPLKQALKALQEVARVRGQKPGLPMMLGEEPTKLIDGLLEDFNRGAGDSRGGEKTRGLGVINRIDTQELAAMSITFESVET